MEKNNDRVDHSYRVIIKTNALEKTLLDAEASQRGFLLTGDAGYVESYLLQLKDIPGIFSALDSLTADNDTQQKNLDTLREVINIQLKVLKANMAQDMDDTLALTRFSESNIYMDKIWRVVNHIKDNEAYLLNERSNDKTKNTSASKRSSLASLTIAFCLCCIASVSIIWFFNRNENYRAQLEDRILQLTILNNDVKELTVASAHNLQEPMRKVQMIIDRLQHFSGISDPKLDEQLNRVKDIYHRQQLTNNVIIDYFDILLSKITKQPVVLKDFILMLKAKHHWAEQLDISIETSKTVAADPSQLELLLTHIINNSLQFKDPLRPCKVRVHDVDATEQKLAIQGRKRGSYDCIAISDNGIGLQETYYTKIFDLFQKLEDSGSQAQNGMGLSFCKRIMLNHSGWITAQKNEPHGLSILLFFPQNKEV